MALYALRQPTAAGLEHLTGPWAQLAIVSIDGQVQHPLALAPSLNILAGAVPPLPSTDLPPYVVTHSGWLPEDAPARDEIYPEDPRVWMGEGRNRLDEIAPWLAEEAFVRGARLALRPHARHVLSDPHACLAFLEAHDNKPIDIALDPVAMLTPDMLSCAEDHLTRIADALFDHPRVAMVLLRNTRRHADDLAPTPVHEGEIESSLLIDLAERALEAAKPLVLREAELARQLGVLRPAGLHAAR